MTTLRLPLALTRYQHRRNLSIKTFPENIYVYYGGDEGYHTTIVIRATDSEDRSRNLRDDRQCHLHQDKNFAASDLCMPITSVIVLH